VGTFRWQPELQWQFTPVTGVSIPGADGNTCLRAAEGVVLESCTKYSSHDKPAVLTLWQMDRSGRWPSRRLPLRVRSTDKHPHLLCLAPHTMQRPLEVTKGDRLEDGPVYCFGINDWQMVERLAQGVREALNEGLIAACGRPLPPGVLALIQGYAVAEETPPLMMLRCGCHLDLLTDLTQRPTRAPCQVSVPSARDAHSGGFPRVLPAGARESEAAKGRQGLRDLVTNGCTFCLSCRAVLLNPPTNASDTTG
jgi:hypothetical protein